MASLGEGCSAGKAFGKFTQAILDYSDGIETEVYVELTAHILGYETFRGTVGLTRPCDFPRKL